MNLGPLILAIKRSLQLNFFSRTLVQSWKIHFKLGH